MIVGSLRHDFRPESAMPRCRHAFIIALLTLPLALGSCATPATPPAPVAVAPAPAPAPIAPPPPAAPPRQTALGEHGVIAAIRAGAADRRGAILGALGNRPAAGLDHGAMEFIIRTQDGRTLSVVQPNTEQLAVGQSVIIQQAKQTHLARAD